MLKILQTTAFLQDLATPHLEKLAAIATEVTFAEGQIIFREGDIGDVLYLIREGQAAVEMHVPGRGRVTILTVGPGQLLGWSALFAQKRKTATGRAVAPIQAITLNASQLREVCQQDCELGFVIIWSVAELIADRLKATRLQLLDVFGGGG
jgi:CRP-like cAMP-binding protein